MTERNNGMGLDDIQTCSRCGRPVWLENGKAECACKDDTPAAPPARWRLPRTTPAGPPEDFDEE